MRPPPGWPASAPDRRRRQPLPRLGAGVPGVPESHQAASDPVEVVVATHPHADRIGCMDWLVNDHTIERCLDRGGEANTAALRRSDEALGDPAAYPWHTHDPVPRAVDVTTAEGDLLSRSWGTGAQRVTNP